MAARTFLAPPRGVRIGGWLAGLAACAAVGLMPAPAPAAEPGVAVSPVEYSGDLPNHLRADIDAVVLEALDPLGLETIDARDEFGCRTLACSLREAQDAHLDHVLLVSIEADDRDYRIVVEAHASSDGRVEFKNDELCELCGHHELLAVITAQVRAIAQMVERGSGPPMLLVRGQPSGATVMLDGEWLGAAPLEVEVPPGPHSVELRAPGYLGQSHRFRARNGIEEVVDYQLSVARVNRHAAQIGGWIGFAAGVAGLGVGATLLAIDGLGHGPTCPGNLRDANGACPNVYTTRTAGIVVASGGGAALLTGISLLVYASPKTRRKNADLRRDRPVVAISPRAGGLQLRF